MGIQQDTVKKFCRECNTKHNPGECPMVNGTPGKKPRGGGKPKAEKPLCFPHKYFTTPWEVHNDRFHVRYKRCIKCTEFQPGYRELSKHKYFLGVCSFCGGTKSG